MNKLKDYIDSNFCFKLILGANNENYEEIKKLTALYSAAGCRFFDINASKEAILAAKEGFKLSGKDDCFLCISIGGKNDPHLSKCKILNDKCIKCKKCLADCIQNAIFEKEELILIDEKKCIGCAKCLNNCPKSAIKRYYKSSEWGDFLPEIKNDCDCIEFHIVSNDIDDINEKWDYLCNNFEGILSICTDRSIFSNKDLISQLKKMIDKCPNRVMIQADGAPMSGGKDDYNTTLQAVACADIIIKSGINCPVIMSGGTNSKTMELARLCNVDVSGVAIGSYARKIVKDYTLKEDFLLNKEEFNKALVIAKNLMNYINKKESND